jgi:hypothetical protein
MLWCALNRWRACGGWRLRLADVADPSAELAACFQAGTPVPVRSFDHATFTNADNKAFPFVADLPDVSVPTRCVMRNAAGTRTVATASRPDSGNDGFTVADGKTAPPPPKS